MGSKSPPPGPAVPSPEEIERRAEEKRAKANRGAYDAMALAKTRTDWKDMVRQAGTGLYIGGNPNA